MPREDHHEFRFTLDGVTLDAEAKNRIASAVQRAGLEALAKAEVPLEEPLILGHGSLKLRPEWRGLWVLNGGLGEELGIKIDEIGFQ
jgi:hypothetical protein